MQPSTTQPALSQMLCYHLHNALLATARTPGWWSPGWGATSCLKSQLCLIGRLVSGKLLKPFLCPSVFISKLGATEASLQNCCKKYLVYLNFPGAWEMLYQC